MTSPSLVPEPAGRLLSLDVLRGITIAFMIMVNNNGGEVLVVHEPYRVERSHAH